MFRLLRLALSPYRRVLRELQALREELETCCGQCRAAQRVKCLECRALIRADLERP